jgi:thiol-disulfide isomerase/thioredoxin
VSQLRPLLVFLVGFVVSVAFAAGVERGWTSGSVAVDTPRILGQIEPAVALKLPKSLSKYAGKDVVIVYFSPTCPHCIAVAAEIEALALRIQGKAEVVWVAAGGAAQADVSDFKKAFQIKGEIVVDNDREIAGVLHARSTPSVVLAKADKKLGHRVDAFWYPFQPGFDTLVEMRLSENPWAPFDRGEFHGNGVCASCHREEMDSWLLTHHAIAWGTLVEKGEHEKAECTGCHVTGNAQPQGWTAGNDLLVDVGCEACHGPGGPHDGQRAEAKDACVGCHDEKHSLSFDYARAVPHIDHFRSHDLDDDGFQKAAMALRRGEVKRPLAGFSGKNVGNGACQSCHPEASAQHQAAPHGKAMATLAGKTDPAGIAADKAVGCVKCHAAPTSSGIGTGETLGEYVTTDGIGCESCHGPGGAHVEAKGAKGTIERLGDDCPVCVIEAVCTSCHTPEWDKDWKLESALDKVKPNHGAP